MSNQQFFDIVHKSEEFGTDKNQCVHLNVTGEANENDSVDNSPAEYSILGDEIQNTTRGSTINVVNATIETEDAKNDEYSNFDENTEETVTTDYALFDSIVINDEVANVAKVMSEINGKLVKKISWLSDQGIYSEDQSKYTSRELTFKSNNMSSSYNNYHSSEDSITMSRNETITRAKEKKSSTDILQNERSRDLLYLETNTLANNITLIDHTHQDNNNIPDLFYETSGDIPKDDTETESGIKERENALEKYFIRDRTNKSKKSQQSRKRSRSNKKQRTRNNDIPKNKRNIFSYQETIQQCIYVIGVNICVTLFVAILLPCIFSAMIDRKLTKHIQCVRDDMLNHTFVSNEYLKLYLDKEIIDGELKYLMDIYLKENDDVLNNYQKNNLSSTTGVNDNKEVVTLKESRIAHFEEPQKATQQLKLKKFTENMVVLKKEIRSIMKQLANMEHSTE